MSNIHEKVWGYEEWIVNESYCGKKLCLRRGKRCSLHYHRDKDETFYIVSGKVYMEIGGPAVSVGPRVIEIMGPGDSVRIHQETVHRFSGIEDSVIIEFSTHHEDDDSYRIERSGEFDVQSHI